MSIRGILDKNPIQITTAIILVVNFFVAAEILEINAIAVASLNSALVGIMGLFVATKTANKRVLNEMVTTTKVVKKGSA